MSNLETRPVEMVCGEPIAEPDEMHGPTVEVLTAERCPSAACARCGCVARSRNGHDP
jgi:hypothetical protein